MPGLYVHIPFCSVKCHYCDFTAFSGQGKAAQRYLSALSAEWGLETEGWRSVLEACQGALPTLYIGGGTPSELSPEELGRLLETLQARHGDGFSFAESTFEANPESLTPEKLRLLHAWGFFRVSIGLQAGQDRLLKALGRQHDLAGFRKSYDAARASGIPSVNVDLMFGLPGQSLADWEETLELVARLAPDHVSLYGLKVEDRTVFAKKRLKAEDDSGADMYGVAVDALTGEGFHHYEISNFARPGHESIHNVGYWKNQPYLGIGCGATSFVGGERRTNEPSIVGYCKAVESGGSAAVSSESLAGKEKLGETVLLGLRLVDGLDLTDEMDSEFAVSWRKLQGSGLVELIGRRARLTRKGLLLANLAFQEFVPPFDAQS